MIGIIGAMTLEIELLKKEIKNCQAEEVGECSFYHGTIENTEVVVAHSGVGKVNAAICTTILLERYKVSKVINTGIAGGFSPLKPRSVVLSTKIGYHDVNATQFGYESGQVPGSPRFFLPEESFFNEVEAVLNKLNIKYINATLLTGDQFINDEKMVTFKTNENTICEMEGAAVAHTCNKFKIPFVSIRYISDIIGEKSQIDDYQKFEEEMSRNSSIICLNIIREM